MVKNDVLIDWRVESGMMILCEWLEEGLIVHAPSAVFVSHLLLRFTLIKNIFLVVTLFTHLPIPISRKAQGANIELILSTFFVFANIVTRS